MIHLQEISEAAQKMEDQLLSIVVKRGYGLLGDFGHG